MKDLARTEIDVFLWTRGFILPRCAVADQKVKQERKVLNVLCENDVDRSVFFVLLGMVREIFLAKKMLIEGTEKQASDMWECIFNNLLHFKLMF